MVSGTIAASAERAFVFIPSPPTQWGRGMAPVVALALPSLGQLPAVTKFNAVPGLMFTRLREFPFPTMRARTLGAQVSGAQTSAPGAAGGQPRLRQESCAMRPPASGRGVPQLHPGRGVIARFVPAAHVTIDARLLEPSGQGRIK